MTITAARTIFDLSMRGVWNIVYVILYVVIILAVLGIIFGIISKAKRNADAKKKYAPKKDQTDSDADKK